jgi:hypothetical protein
MRDNAAPAMQCFVGVGLLIVAWRFAPGPHSDTMLYFLSGVFAYCGAVMLITGFRRSHPTPSPLPGLIGRAVWALRPRSWMIAWALIYMLATIYGTPHLAFNYPPRTPAGVCEYVGWRGAVVAGGKSNGQLNGCPVVILL